MGKRVKGRLMLRSRWLPQLCLLAVSTLFALGLGELAVRMARPGFPGFAIPQTEHRPAPGLGYEMIPNQVAYTFASKVTINSAGLRGPEIRLDEGFQGRRVLCLGDSITYGVGVDDDTPYPRQLERLLGDVWGGAPVEVINAGVQRYATYQEIDQLRRLAGKLSPDIVVLGVYINDLKLRPKGNDVREYELEREQAASAFRNRFPRVYLAIKNLALGSLAREILLSTASSGSAENIFKGESTERSEKKWAAHQEELREFYRLAETHPFRPLVVTIPSRHQVVHDFPNSSYPARVLTACQELGLPAIDVLSRFKSSLAEGLDPYLPWDNHLSEVGHRLVAEAIRDALREVTARP